MILPLSARLLADTARYFESLKAYRTGDIEPIVSTFIDATFKSLDNASCNECCVDDIAHAVADERWVDFTLHCAVAVD